jgi:hypothetical protein
MTLFRRFLVIVALMFWQGGFFFYASVVVPVGTDVFARHYPTQPGGTEASGKRQQGRITRTVAMWLNVFGVAAVVPLAWDLSTGIDTGRRRRWRVLLGVVVAVLLAVEIWLFFLLDEHFDRAQLRLNDAALFHIRHRTYLWLYAAQWGCCLLYLLLTLRAWSEADANRAG